MPDWVLWVVIGLILFLFAMGFWFEFGVAGFSERRSHCPACGVHQLDPVEPAGANGRLRCYACRAEFREESDGTLTRVDWT